MSDSPVTTNSVGDVAHISFDDGKANAFDFVALGALRSQLADAAAGGAKAVVLSGRDGKFSAGFNLGVMTGSPDDARRLLEEGALFAIDVFMAPIPVVLGVTGHAIAMGGILTCAGDYRVGASGNFKLGLNEVANGMPVPRFGVELCRDRLTPAWFNRCVQMAELCNPDDAVRAGFLDEVVEPGAVIERSLDVATQLAGYVHGGPFAWTRPNIRGRLTERLKSELAEDVALFSVAS